jgi:hypothetical protein
VAADPASIANHLSIVDGGREALLEILSLYNFADSPLCADRRHHQRGR